MHASLWGLSVLCDRERSSFAAPLPLPITADGVPAMLAVLSGIAVGAAAGFKHMNDVHYTVGNPAPGAEGKAMEFHGKSFFHVDSPKFKSRYSQVVWHALEPVPLPEDIVKEYDGKVMSVTGWEVDVLREVNGTTESVPCYESYNHHYGASLAGSAVPHGAPGPLHCSVDGQGRAALALP